MDVRAKNWVCPFCLQRNPLPENYREIAENLMPPELTPQFTTVEDTIQRRASVPPVLLFVVDTCVDEEDLGALKESLVMALRCVEGDGCGRSLMADVSRAFACTA